MKLLILLLTLFLTACGPSAEEKRQVEMEQQRIEKEASEKLAQEKVRRIAAVTCSIMSETRNMDSAVRVREMNDAREEIGGEPFLDGDSAIKESFEYGLCQELVLNETYDEKLQSRKDARRERERLAREKRAEEARIAEEKRRIAAEEKRIAAEEKRIAAEKQAEERRIAAEKQAEEKRIAAEKYAEEKPIRCEKRRLAEEQMIYGNDKQRVKELLDCGHGVSFSPDGNIEMIRMMKNNVLHGLLKRFHRNGKLMFKVMYENGQKVGLQENYDDDGNLTAEKCFKDGSQVSLEKCN